jgi:hypothetical protein
MGQEGDALKHVHITHEAVAVEELTPPHEPREDTPAYRRAHERLIHELKRPCYFCGVTEQLETHHFPVERSLAGAVDIERLAVDHPEVRDFADLMDWVDSEHNLLVLCADCHRGPGGIHHALAQDVFIRRYAKRGYIFAASPSEVPKDEAFDEQIIQEDK